MLARIYSKRIYRYIAEDSLTYFTRLNIVTKQQAFHGNPQVVKAREAGTPTANVNLSLLSCKLNPSV